MFVAGFIGSPAMNFFEAKLDRRDGGLLVDLGSVHLPIPKNKTDALSNYIGKPIFFGIRPEDIHDAQFVPPGIEAMSKFSTNVNVIEPLGSEVFAYIENGGKEMVARFDPRTSARIGQPVEVVADMDKVHVFDRESEKALV
jgi:multiple sugar transport system ATP-binding protein